MEENFFKYFVKPSGRLSEERYLSWSHGIRVRGNVDKWTRYPELRSYATPIQLQRAVHDTKGEPVCDYGASNQDLVPTDEEEEVSSESVYSGSSVAPSPAKIAVPKAVPKIVPMPKAIPVMMPTSSSSTASNVIALPDKPRTNANMSCLGQSREFLLSAI